METSSLNEKEKKELKGLLGSVTITSNESVLRRGKGLDLAVGVWPSSESSDEFDMMISAYRPGQARIDLTGVEMEVRVMTEGHEIRRPGLTRRGDMTFKGLPLDARYTFHWFANLGPVGQSVPAFAAAPADGGELAEPAIYDSADGKLHATILENPSGTITVAAETSDPALSGKRVRFYFVQKSGKIEFTKDMELSPKGEIWEASWDGEVSVSEPCEFFFEVLPA